MLRWAFDTLDLNRVQAETDTRNVASARVLAKLGPGAVEVLAQGPLRCAKLVVAERRVVEHAVAGDVVERLAFVQAPCRPPDHHRKLAFEVQLNGLARTPQGLSPPMRLVLKRANTSGTSGILNPPSAACWAKFSPDANDLAGPRDRRLQRHSFEVYRLAVAKKGMSTDQCVLTLGEQEK